VVEHLTSKCEALSSNTRKEGKKRFKKRKKKEEMTDQFLRQLSILFSTDRRKVQSPLRLRIQNGA
jgi:hypothetical protein